MFRSLSQTERATIAVGLLNEWRFRVVTDGTKAWVIKHNGDQDYQKRDLLGFLLGENFCNVSEVKLLNGQELESIKQYSLPNEYFSVSNTYLVRLAHSYSLEELPCKTIEEAVASELVYSIWIRRRDAHTDNRVYIKGIPIFFDSHVAFLCEPELADINIFFSQTQDHGRAGLWRVKIWNNFLAQFTGAFNAIETGPFHYVNDIYSFYKHVEKSKTKLKERVISQMEECVQKVKFDNTREAEIINFLRKNFETLDEDIAKMLKVISKDS